MKSIAKVLSVLFISLLIFGCGTKADKKIVEIKTEDKTVRVFSAKKGSFTQTRTVSAQTDANKDITLSSETNGKVEWLRISVGDTVFAGQLIAKVDEKMAHAQLDVASANYSFALSNYERQKQLYDKKIVSDQQFDQAKNQLETAKAGLELSMIQQQNTSIYAPFRGIIAAKFIDENELINVGKPIVRIVNLDTIKIIVDVVEQDMTNLRLGDLVNVEIPSLRQSTFSGIISKIGYVASPQSKTFPVEVLVSNPSHMIKAGMVSSVNFKTDKYNSVVVVPQDLIIEGENFKGVMIASGNKVELREVKVTPPEKEHIGVISGIEANEKIIYVGHKSVSNGESIKVIEDKSYVYN
ncbi:MAG TPA: hypothetical protein DCS13_06980 [Candidatus Margulisbacteria bacterium]|nr:MAG: hypothetical protein A2X43_03240 [Candidatus Margulisbacteria bacterium GWD2_39_127]HAR63190.1 hypothetical protein [Candidatus Margulisiibacteriota bacterium]